MSFFRVPNRLIQDDALSFNARRLGALLYSRRNALGTCRKSLKELAMLAHCSMGTVQTALKDLQDHKYISCCKRFRNNIALGRKVYSKTEYTCNLAALGKYTIVPRSIFQRPVKASSFVILLFFCLVSGNAWVRSKKPARMFPSLSYIAHSLSMARSTAIRCIQELKDANLIYVQACIKADGSHSENSYFFVNQAVKPPAQVSPPCPIPLRACHLALGRLGTLLARRHATFPPASASFPLIGFQPLQLRWKPPFYGGSGIFANLC